MSGLLFLRINQRPVGSLVAWDFLPENKTFLHPGGVSGTRVRLWSTLAASVLSPLGPRITHFLKTDFSRKQSSSKSFNSLMQHVNHAASSYWARAKTTWHCFIFFTRIHVCPFLHPYSVSYHHMWPSHLACVSSGHTVHMYLIVQIQKKLSKERDLPSFIQQMG